MRVKSVVVLLIVVLLFSCFENEKKTNQVVESVVNSPEAFTLEFAIGGAEDKNSEEFLLAEPQIVEVKYNGDILVIDENRIKVFDSQGNEKIIVGRRGEGPGEFGSRFVPYISPSGYLVAADVNGLGTGQMVFYGGSSSSNHYNLFAPDYSFIEKVRIGNNNRINKYLEVHDFELENMRRITKFVPLDRDKLLFEAVFEKIESGREPQYYQRVLYDNGSTITQILEKELLVMYGSTKYPEGELHWKVLPGNRIFYQNANEDIFDLEKGSYYTIHILSFEDGKDISGTREFTQVEFPEKMTTAPARKGNPGDQLKIDKARVYKEKKYYAAVEIVKVDGRYAFIFLNQLPESIQRNPLRVPAEIFDLENCQFLTTIEFPFYPYVIRNGYAFNKTIDEDGFPVIQKYRINPSVYGK
ncbi:hypothetical protein ACFL7D_03205 [candidate division KSB1 bacterium]